MAGTLLGESGEIINGQGHSNRHRKPKISSKSILPDMVDLNIDEKLKKEAELIYRKMGSPTKKNDERKKMVFCCLHFAHAELDIIHSVKELTIIVGIKCPDKFRQAVGAYSMSKYNFHPPQRFYSIEKYAKLLCDKINYNINFRYHIFNICKKKADNYPAFEDMQPDLLAAGVILYVDDTMSDQPYLNLLGELEKYVVCNNKKLLKAKDQIIQMDNHCEVTK